MQLEKLTNQVRFVQMIIKKELVVSGKKRAEIIRDLKSKGFKTFPKVVKANVQGEPEEPTEQEEEEVEDTSDSPDNGYDYLLTVFPRASMLIYQMQIYSLTNERVERLRAQQSNKENELNTLLKLSAKDIWTHDLDDVSEAWQEVLRNDILAAQNDKSGKKKGATSKFAKVSRKRASDAADGEYMDKKPKAAKTKANGSPGQSKQSKITSFTSKPTGSKEMHTAAFTSVNKSGSSSFAVPKKAEITKATPIMSIDDDDEFESLIKGIRPDTAPETIDLLSPQTAMKPKKTFTIPGTRKPSALTAPKPRAASKPKAPKRKVDSDDDEDSFAFMADDKPSAPVNAGERRPARAAATKARAIVLTSDDVFDEEDEEDGFEDED